MSGLIVFGRQVPVHRVQLQALENGTLMAYCPNHLTRMFISERVISSDIKKNAKILDRLFPPVKKTKEAKNGKT